MADNPRVPLPAEEPGADGMAAAAEAPEAEDRVAVAANWTLVWWRFRKNRLALVSAAVLLLFYLVVLVPDFFATQDPETTEAARAFIPLKTVHLFDAGRLRPWVPSAVGKRNAVTLRMEWAMDDSRKIPIRFFARGYAYKILWLIPTRIHLLGSVEPGPENAPNILGTDRLGRDQWSRIMFGTRTSMTVGLVSVALSVILGILLGGLSGYKGGWLDMVIQRVIELLQSLPTIPIWLLMTAALPRDWRPEQVFFAITIILAFIGWTTLGREVRGRFLSLREEDFVLAAELAGCSRLRIIGRHMVPTFMSHIIASSTLAIPVMIISETSLSFLGLGIRPPAISWGVLLQEAQNIQTVALAPWLLLPGALVIVSVLAFNLVGDGLRDAADPYGDEGAPGTTGTASRAASPPGEAPLLSVRNLKAHFPLHEGTVRAVDGVSFDVYPGRVFGIVGESGCGKSVTMKAILRIIEPPGRIVAGEILLYRKVPAGSPAGAPVDIAGLEKNGRRMRSIRGAEIALIPQEPMASFSPVHTIGNQVLEAIRLHRDVDRAEAREIAVQLFKDVGIPMPDRRLDEYSWQLSGGLRQRAVIATALSCNPRLLIADEPTTAVDVTTQAQVLRLLRRLQRERGSAIVFITHDLGVIAQMADDVTVMYLGLVMEQGPVDAIFHAPLHPYTQALLRSIPSAASTPRQSLPTISGSIPHPIHRPPGCPFHPRCHKRIRGKCDSATPALRMAGAGQRVRCFLYGNEEETP